MVVETVVAIMTTTIAHTTSKTQEAMTEMTPVMSTKPSALTPWTVTHPNRVKVIIINAVATKEAKETTVASIIKTNLI